MLWDSIQTRSHHHGLSRGKSSVLHLDHRVQGYRLTKARTKVWVRPKKGLPFFESDRVLSTKRGYELSLCKCPRQKWHLSMCDLSALPVQPNHDLMMSKARNVIGEVKITACFLFPSTSQPAQDGSAVQGDHPCARQIKHSGNSIHTLPGGIFPLLSNPMKPGLEKTVEPRE